MFNLPEPIDIKNGIKCQSWVQKLLPSLILFYRIQPTFLTVSQSRKLLTSEIRSGIFRVHILLYNQTTLL